MADIAPSGDSAPAAFPLRDSIAARLLRIIFGAYLVVAVLVTCFQLALEYRDTENRVAAEIHAMQYSFGRAISDAMWNYNTEVLRGIMSGIKVIPIVQGVKIEDEKGALVRALGTLQDEHGRRFRATPEGHLSPVERRDGLFDDVFSRQFPIVYTDEHGAQRLIGRWTVYSNQQVIVNQVKYAFLLILVNAVLKTLALWFIFLYVVRRWLGRPLQQLSEFVGKLNIDNLGDKEFVLEDRGRHELHLLASKINAMANGLRNSVAKNAVAEAELKRNHERLEELVAERTAELTLAKELADAANRGKSAFLANMSHELRTPLNAVLGFAKMLKQEQGLTARQLLGLDTIQKSGEHLLGLIDDVLDLAKVEAGKIELVPEPVDLREFLDLIAQIIRVRAHYKALRFVVDLPGGLPRTACFDAKRLRQVLLNLLNNAVKFTDDGHVTLRARVMRRCDTRARLRFEVEDSGVGIAPDLLEAVFLRFEQAGEATHRAQGTGLGLAISRQLVRLMGGDIHADSQPGQGSRFWFELELPIVHAPALADAGAPKQIIAGYLGPRFDAAESALAAEVMTPLVAPPPDEIEALYQLAKRGNMQSILMHADHLATLADAYRPFTERLCQLAERFESRAVLKFIESFRQSP